MKAIGLCRFTACVVMLVAAASVVTSRAARTETQRDTYDITHFVRFETGGTWLRDGDQITIDEVHGTADQIAKGNLYEIKGSYKLASHEKAQLAVEVTSSDTRHFPSLRPQYMSVDKGDGHFTVYLYMWTDGNPHMSFYPTDNGSSFASVYFGTGENVLKHASWLDDPAH